MNELKKQENTDLNKSSTSAITSFNTCDNEKSVYYKHPLEKPLFEKEKSNLFSSKSEDSLDSGVCLRQKSFNSMDSLNSSEGSFNGEAAAYIGLSPSDEAIPPLPTNQYEDYLRECQDIRQSIVICGIDEEKQPVSRTDSGEDHDEDSETEWFRMAGLSDLVMSPSSTIITSTDGTTPSPGGPDNFSSMTVLSTLTRPQREAVLRRISSFNRAQKSKRRSKPSITSIFPNVDLSTAVADNDSNCAITEAKFEKPSQLSLDSLNLPQNMEASMGRRFSDVTRIRAPTMPTSVSIEFGDNSTKSDYSSKHKKSVDSIVASSMSEGVQTLRVSSKPYSDESWHDAKNTSPMNEVRGKAQNMSYTKTASEETLPNFSLVKDRLGITKISDLHPVDMRKVQSLAIIELTALFDLRDLDLKRRKSGKSKVKETGVFGTPLTVLVEWDRKRTNNNELRVPIVLSEIIAFLEKNALRGEGILRKSGSAARIKQLKQDIDTKYGVNSSVFSEVDIWKDAYPNDVAALLKQFLRELPDPILTTQFIDAFQSCSSIPERKEQLQALNLLIILLNEVHRDSLKLLLKFLNLVVLNEQYNKMCLNNVAMITAPNLFIADRKSKKDLNTSNDLKHAAGTSNIVRMLIKYHKLLWTIPAFMLSQVRIMNSAQLVSKKHHSTSKDKYKKFFQGGRSKDLKKSQQPSGQNFDYETPKGLIRVQGPNVQLTSIAVQLDDKLTAGDVIAKYFRHCERMRRGPGNVSNKEDKTVYALYETGGNIHERCLDIATNMSALLGENPEASWVIKARKDT